MSSDHDRSADVAFLEHLASEAWPAEERHALGSWLMRGDRCTSSRRVNSVLAAGPYPADDGWLERVIAFFHRQAKAVSVPNQRRFSERSGPTACRSRISQRNALPRLDGAASAVRRFRRGRNRRRIRRPRRRRPAGAAAGMAVRLVSPGTARRRLARRLRGHRAPHTGAGGLRARPPGGRGDGRSRQRRGARRMARAVQSCRLRPAPSARDGSGARPVARRLGRTRGMPGGVPASARRQRTGPAFVP